MSTTKRGAYKVFNGTDFDIINFQSDADNHSVYRQALINGNFDVWQRGTSSTGSGYVADRWYTSYDGTITKTYSQQSFTLGQTQVPNNPNFFFRTQVTSASGQTWNTLGQKIEDVNTFAGMTVTLSFWAKADAARTITAMFKQNFGNGGSTSVNGTSSSFNLNTTWQKFTATYTLASIAGKTIGANNHLDFFFGMPVNTAFTIDIAQVQINAGSTALPFSPRSYAEELRACQRYFYRMGSENGAWTKFGNGMCVASGTAYININFMCKMRVPPTLSNSSGLCLMSPTANPIAINAIYLDMATDYNYGMNVSSSGLTTGNATILAAYNSTTCWLAFDAEL